MNTRHCLVALIAVLFPLQVLADGPIDGTLYGKINLSLDYIKNDDDAPNTEENDLWELNSNNSRIGIKGETDLNEGFSVIYKLEWEVHTDGDEADMDARNRYIGLASDRWGSVLAGKHDTPTKLAQNNIDQFNDLPGDLGNTYEGENRINDIVMYQSPNFAGFGVTAAFAPAEEEFGGDSKAGDANDHGLADGYSVALTYEIDGLYAALALDEDIDGQDLIRLVGQYTLGDLQLGAMVQENDNQSGTIDEQGVFFSAAYTLGQGTLKAQMGLVENDCDDAGVACETGHIAEETTFSLGYAYKVANNTQVHGFLTRQEDSRESEVFPALDNTDITETILGVGVIHNF